MSSVVPGNNSFHLEWNNHLGNMQSVLESLYTQQSLVDVTLACKDGVLKAHKVILSACSPYFEAVFRETPCKHPVLILKGVHVREMQALLRFMYCGQVDVPEAELSSLVATACEFKVKGFAMDNVPGIGDYRPDSASDHETDGERLQENSNFKIPSNGQVNMETRRQLRVIDEEPTVTPVIVDSQSLQNVSVDDTSISEETKEKEESDNLKKEQQNSEEQATSPKTAKADDASLVVKEETSSGPNESSAANNGNNIATSSSNSPATSNSVGVSNPANGGDATPFRRETRYKGQKRVDVGIRPPIGRPRYLEKRESSSENRNSSGSSHPQRKIKTPASIRKTEPTGNTEQTLSCSVGNTEGKKIIIGSSEIDISISRVGGSIVPDGPESAVEIKMEAESADEEEEDEEATADMFCIPHLQELPETDGLDISMSGEGLELKPPKWNVLPQPSSGREQRNIPEPPGDSGEGDMACPYCFTRCRRFSDLKKHMRLHTEDKPHECEFCSLAFARASHLARHRRTHTGERPFHCPAPACDRTFSRQDKLKLHTQRAHPGLPCDLVQSGSFMRIRGRRRIREKNPPSEFRAGVPQLANSTVSSSAISSSHPSGPALISLPFGDTSYLTSLSLGQQRYSDLTISPVNAASFSGTSGNSVGSSNTSLSGMGAEELLKSVRQLGECTIQTLPSKILAE